MKSNIFIIVALLIFTSVGCNDNASKQDHLKDTMNYVVNAPEINTKFGWLNTDTSYTIKDLKGKIVLLDFWTFGCINCQHILPELRKLEEEFENELVVIGVHSAKFEAERGNEKIEKAILKFGIRHPVVNDAAFEIWKRYAVRAWPTVVLITPDGKIAAQKSGEGFYQSIRASILKLKNEYASKINSVPFAYANEPSTSLLLKFPSKLLLTADGKIFISNTGHNQILQIDEAGNILLKIGSGKAGLVDGSYELATFSEPHGMVLRENFLYVADAKNNAIRKIDLLTKTVSTIAGNGIKGRYYDGDKANETVLPNSPWDLCIADAMMYVANAGNHQILKMDLKTEKLCRFAGNGREALKNGKALEASFNQPSGLAIVENNLYVADAEASAIRKINLQTTEVSTIVGKGLFEFGDKDGDLNKALLQHCVGLANADGKLLVADTYNGKIKLIDFSNSKIITIVAGLDEPNAVVYANDRIYYTDTNNHRLYTADLKLGKKKEIVVKGIL